MKNYLFIFALFVSACGQPEKKETSDATAQQKMDPYGCCTPDILDTAWFSSGKKAPLFSGLDGIRFPITTSNPEAQTYFNQGMMLSFGFNHAEAARAFFEAARQDTACAMCWWGYAFVLGPNYNGGMDPDHFDRAYQAVQKANSLTGPCTQKEKDLIDALTYRYTNDTTVARATLDSAFAEAMRRVYKKYPGDVNIGALFAESLMDLHPWNLWRKDGTIQPWTHEIMTVLENCLKIDSLHAGANHFYIHATEMSFTAEMASESARRLETLVPGSGHLVHMPSHTYIRTGRYHDGVVANQKAVEVDSLYFVACHAQGVYPLAYYPHNHHFIAACATFSGESKLAMIGANATAEHAHKKLLRETAWATLQHYYAIPWYVMAKLGMWDDIRKSPSPDTDLKYPSIIWNYAQGMASLAQGKPEDAAKSLAAIHEIMKDTSLKELTIWGINNIYDLCVISSKVLEGELLAKQKKFPQSIALLREAVTMEDALNYNEPPDWFFSIRHHLGAVLLEAGKYDEAIQTYEADLKVYRENGWALRGLMNAYAKTGDTKNLQTTKARFENAWKHADIKIESSRIL